MSKPEEARVEEKLYQNRYVVDGGRSHIRVVARDKPSANLLAMTNSVPGRLLHVDRGRSGRSRA